MALASRALATSALVTLMLAGPAGRTRQAPPSGTPPFAWPQGVRAAVSLTFDDARDSQLDVGVPLFAEFRTHVTFYLTANAVGPRRADWKRAASAGHELGNHTMVHPCSGNFPWARKRALEDYTPGRMRTELIDANQSIAAATGVVPVTFAYPCGQTFVGRAESVASVVPLVHELFLAGRGWLDEGPNDPAFVDRAQLFGYPMDDMAFSQLKTVVDDALARGQWLVLAGHDIGAGTGRQVTRVSTLRELLTYLQAPARGVWVDTVARVAEHVKRMQPPGPPPRE
jgi:peptidoglycan/xylan/chitin deacetylase (PgdA/CDA1 family)